MAVMTNITAINRLLDAKRGLEKQEREKNKMRIDKVPAMITAVTFLLIGF